MFHPEEFMRGVLVCVVLSALVFIGFLSGMKLESNKSTEVAYKDQCQKHFNLKTKNTTIYEQEKVLHREDKPARIVIECEVRK